MCKKFTEDDLRGICKSIEKRRLFSAFPDAWERFSLATPGKSGFSIHNYLGGTQMKKLISLLLVLAMALTLVACGGAKAEETQSPA